MSTAHSARIHPTAVISVEADLADDVIVAPYVVIEGAVKIGPGCVLRPHAHLCGPLVMGSRNLVSTGCVFGERPQHQKYNDEPTSVAIGDDNVFREHVTIHRGTTHSWTTRIGSHNFIMAHSHIAHDCQIGNHCILANGALLGGHCHLEDNVYLSGNAAVHQFSRIGRLAMLGGLGATTRDIPPFVLVQQLNYISGLNLVGMRRSGMTSTQINAMRRVYHMFYLEGHTIPNALAMAESELGHIDVVMEFVNFVRQSSRGISAKCDLRHSDAA